MLASLQKLKGPKVFWFFCSTGLFEVVDWISLCSVVVVLLFLKVRYSVTKILPRSETIVKMPFWFLIYCEVIVWKGFSGLLKKVSSQISVHFLKIFLKFRPFKKLEEGCLSKNVSIGDLVWWDKWIKQQKTMIFYTFCSTLYDLKCPDNLVTAFCCF